MDRWVLIAAARVRKDPSMENRSWLAKVLNVEFSLTENDDIFDAYSVMDIAENIR